MLMLDRSPDRLGEERDAISRAAKVAAFAFTLLVAANIAVGFAECGVGPCPDNPTGYWLFGTGKMSD